MALRTIAVRFNTNVSTFTSDMTRATVSVDRFTVATQRAAAARAELNALSLAGFRAGDAAWDAAAMKAKRASDDVVRHHSAAVQSFAAGVGKIMLVTGAAIGIGLAAATKQAATFERQMRDVNAISAAVTSKDFAPDSKELRVYNQAIAEGMTEQMALAKANEAQFKNLGDTILDMSRSSEHAISDFANTMYDIASAGIFGARALEILHQADIAATAGQTSMKTAAEGLLAVLNAYGAAAPSVAEVNDVLFQTVRVGVVRFEELSHQLGQFVGIAAVAGLAPEQWGAAIATFTRAGIPAAQAGTTLNRVLSSLINPGTELANRMKQVGIENIQTSLSTEGLNGVMARLLETTHGNVVEIAKLFPQFRAARGVFALAAASGRLYKDVQDEFGIGANRAAGEIKLAGAASRAYAENQKSLSYQLGVTKNAINASAVELGQHLLPVAKQGIAIIRGMALQFGEMSEGGKKTTTIILAIASALLVVGGAALVLIPKIGAMAEAFVALGVSEEFAATASLALGGALALITVAVGIWAYTQAKSAAATAKLTDLTNAHVDAMKAETQATLDAAKASKDYSDMATLRKKVLEEFAEFDGGKVLKSINSLKTFGATVSDVVSASLGDKKATDKVTNALARAMKITPQDLEKAGVSKDMAEAVNRSLEKTVTGQKGGLQGLKSQLAGIGQMYGVYLPESAEKYLDVAGDIGKEHIAQGKAVAKLTELNKANAQEQEAAVQSAESMRYSLSGLQKMGLSLSAAMAVQSSQVEGFGEAVQTAEGKMAPLTEAQKDLQKAMLSFIDVNEIFKDSLKEDETLLKGLKDGADVARDSLQGIRDAARTKAEADTAKANDALEAQNRVIDEQVRKQTDDIRDRADRQAQAITDAAQGGSAASRNAASRQAKAIKEAADERIDAIEEAARKEKQANSDAKEKASDNAKAAADAVVLSRDQFMKDLNERAKAAQEYHADMKKIADMAGDADVTPLLESLQALGTDGVSLVKEFANSTPEAIADALAKLTQLEPKTEASLEGFEKKMQQKVVKARQWRDNLFALTAAGFGDVARALAAQGQEGAPLVEQALARTKSPEGRKKLEELGAVYADALTMGSDGYAKGLDLQLQGIEAVAAANGAESGKAFAASLVDNATVAPGTAHDILRSIEDALRELDPELAVKLKVALDAEEVTFDESSFDKTRGANGPGSYVAPPSPTANQKVTRNAQGNMVRFFAQGGMENHVAQIARPTASTRVWAEPETGGEAYIPLAASKRKRSTDILRTVAEDFGYHLSQNIQKNAEGNVYPPGRMMAQQGGGAGGNVKVVVQPVMVPVQTVRKYEFGDITGPTMTDIERYAEQKQRQTALTGVPV